MLEQAGFPTQDLRPKAFSDFAAEGAQALDFVFTLHDVSAGEPLPQWPGLPITADWNTPDPLSAGGDELERHQAMVQVLKELERRLAIFVNLPLASLDRMSLQAQVDELGRPVPAPAS